MTREEYNRALKAQWDEENKEKLEQEREKAREEVFEQYKPIIEELNYYKTQYGFLKQQYKKQTQEVLDLRAQNKELNARCIMKNENLRDLIERVCNVEEAVYELRGRQNA